MGALTIEQLQQKHDRIMSGRQKNAKAWKKAMPHISKISTDSVKARDKTMSIESKTFIWEKRVKFCGTSRFKPTRFTSMNTRRIYVPNCKSGFNQ